MVEAVQFTEEMARGDVVLPDGVRMSRVTIGPPPKRTLIVHSHRIETLEGSMFVEIGDFIITGVQGEKYPCKAEIFHATYTRVEEGEAS